jgi:outer membrane receptor protein involved in Fe transport
VRPLPAIAFLVLLPAASAQVQTLDPLTVSATRSPEPVSTLPFTVEVVPGPDLSDGSSLTVDDALRSSADFSLFRRNDSMTANPTTQGVSLRGLGPSGASRSLVLLDGVPLNDPFGGWVPWSAVPVDSLAAAEIIPGGGASAWGSAALSGVIQLFSAAPAAGTGAVVVQAGDFGTRSAGLAQAVAAGPGTLELRANAFSTDGVVLVAPEGRGPVDIDAASHHDVESARWQGPVGGGVTATVTLRRFEEWRDNGTPYQQNQVLLLLGSVVLSGPAGQDGTWSLTAYTQSQESSQTFSSVNLARTAETPASDQFGVPATAFGIAGSSTWTDATGGRTTVGLDLRDVAGETREDYLYSGGAYDDQRFAGGRQAIGGLFAEHTQAFGPDVHAVAGLRLDRWEDSDGHLRNTSIATGNLLLATVYPTSAGDDVSPSLGLSWQATRELKFHVDGQRAFRQPTLNELYRPFRVGSTTTLANAALATEHADTAEIGASWKRGPLEATLEGFAARLENPVENVTLAQGPGTFPLFGFLPAGSVGQERLNIGRVETRGVQLGATWAASDAWSLNLSGIGETATVASAAVEPGLVGKALPEVPRWTGALSLSWHPKGRFSGTLRARAMASQFDDDQNQLPLASFTEIDLSLRFRLSSHAELFGSVDNLGDTRIETAHSAAGVYNLAPPRLAGAGARLSW